jgi:hypothetical protein
MNATRLAAVALIAGLVLPVGLAAGQHPDRELRAAEMFDLGLARKEADDWTGACQAFAESQRLSPAVATQLNLAECKQREGRLLEAAEILRDAIAAAKAKADRVRGDRAEADLVAIVALTPRIAFDVPAGLQAKATIDGAAVADLSETILIDPGSHDVVVSIDGEIRVRRTVTLGQSAIERIRIEPAEEASGPGGPGGLVDGADRAGDGGDRTTAPRRDGAMSSPSNRHRTLVIGTGVGAALLAAAGSYLLVSAYQLEDDSYDRCDDLPSCDPTDRDAAIDLVDRAIARQQLATGVLIGAGVVSGAAAVLWWTGRPRATAVDVEASPGGAAVVVRGAF